MRIGEPVMSRMGTNGRGGERIGRAGQATIEFALTMMLLLSISFFYIQVCLVMAWGNYVHYATFMSARALLSGGGSQDAQIERAKRVLTGMVKRRGGADRFPGIAKGTGGGEPTGAQIGPGDGFEYGNKDQSWQEGVRYTFRSRLFTIPLGSAGGSGAASGQKGANDLTLTSESWLLRERTYEECLGEKTGVIDNGC